MKMLSGRCRHLLFGVLALALLPLGAQMRARGENDKPSAKKHVAKKEDAKLEVQVPAEGLSTGVENDPLVKEYQNQIRMIEAVMAKIESRAVQGKDHPTYRAWAARAQQVQAELEKWEKLLRTRLAADLTGVENDPLVKEYQNQIRTIEAVMAKIESRAVQGKDHPTYRAWAARAQRVQAELEKWKKLLRTRLAADLREGARKEAARKADANRPVDFDELRKWFGQRNDERFKENHKRIEDLVREMLNRQGMFALPDLLQESRLGAELRKPSATLADQLDLPNGQGLVLEEVGAKSAAAKAGLKKHDILLELNGKPVPSKEEDFAELLKGIQVGKPVDAVVLRKGTKKTFKGLTLPEAKKAKAEVAEFTVKHSAANGQMTVKGNVDQGKAVVTGVTIKSDDGKTKAYDCLGADGIDNARADASIWLPTGAFASSSSASIQEGLPPARLLGFKVVPRLLRVPAGFAA